MTCVQRGSGIAVLDESELPHGVLTFTDRAHHRRRGRFTARVQQTNLSRHVGQHGGWRCQGPAFGEFGTGERAHRG